MHFLCARHDAGNPMTLQLRYNPTALGVNANEHNTIEHRRMLDRRQTSLERGVRRHGLDAPENRAFLPKIRPELGETVEPNRTLYRGLFQLRPPPFAVVVNVYRPPFGPNIQSVPRIPHPLIAHVIPRLHRTWEEQHEGSRAEYGIRCSTAPREDSSSRLRPPR